MSVEIPDSELDIDHNQVGRYEGRLFSGIVYDLWPDGKRRCEIPYVEGVQEGTARDWYASGRLAVETEYRNGCLHGKQREWDEEGRLRLEKVYEYGILVERRAWDKDGHLIAQFRLTPEHPNYEILEIYRRLNPPAEKNPQ